jgi:hypothetical protein
MEKVDEFRQRAEHYRRLKWQIRDPAMLRAISEAAAEFEMTAEEFEFAGEVPKAVPRAY